MITHHRLLPLACMLAWLSACTEPNTADEGGDETGASEDEPALGDTPLPSCEAAMFSYAQLEAELRLPSPDVDYIVELYRGQPPDFTGESPLPGGTALQRFVREVDARLGRVDNAALIDDGAIEQALEAALATSGDDQKLALIDVLASLRTVALLDVRARLAGVADALPDPLRDPSLHHAEWDMAWCVWDGAFHELALAASDNWEPLIVDAFESGSAGIIGPEARWAPDEFAVKPAKQIIEKGSFGVVARNLLLLAEQASGGDAFAAREALGLFAMLEDRVAGRNTPAIEIIMTMLSGDPAAIDPSVIEEALAIAFVKRARKYCDEALLAESIGTADGVKGVHEGILYTQIILPLMNERLADQGFDGDAYMQTWTDYLDAVTTDDADPAIDASETLLMWNCAFQTELGIAECTDSTDES